MPASRYDFSIDKGSTFRRVLIIKQTDGTLVNITGWSVAGKIRKTYQAAAASVSFTCVVDNTTSKITISLTANQTGSLDSGRQVYDLEVTDSAGTVSRLMQGVVDIRPEATR